jgi:CRP-like cAMP-binding protein
MKPVEIVDILKELTLFASLNTHELLELSGLTSLCHYEQDEIVFREGEYSQHLLILIEGVVSVYKHDSKGNEIVIGYFNKYALLAEPATLRRTPLPSSIRFQSEGTLLKVSLDGFEKFLLNHPKLSFEVTKSLLSKIELLQQNIHFNLASNAKEKVLNFYMKNPRLARDLKQYEIASILGMTAETFSRNVAQLLQENVLTQTATGYRYVQSDMF